MAEHDPSGGPTAAAALDGLRERATSPADRQRVRFIESFARRAARHDGDARRVLDERLAALLAQAEDALGADRAGAGEPAAPPRDTLADLVAHIAAQRVRPPATGAETPAGATVAADAAPVDPQALAYFRRTWSRLSADQRLAQSLSTLPENAGPLNSHHLVHRALTLMRDLSPAYFDQVGAYLDALLWIERANAAGEPVPAARMDGDRKVARGRPG